MRFTAGSIPKLPEEISRRIDLVPAKNSAPTFMGIPVVEDWRLQPNTAVILSNGEIVNIINFS